MAAPKATHCRHCGLGGELYKGAHRECKNAHDRKIAAAKRGPNHCRSCEVVIEDGFKLCADCAADSRREALKRYEAKRREQRICACGCGQPVGFGKIKYAAGHAPAKTEYPSYKRRQQKVREQRAHLRSTSVRRCACGCREPLPPDHKGRYFGDHAKRRKAGMKAIFKAEAEDLSSKPVIPANVEVKRIAPVGVAGMSFRDYSNA